MVQIVEKKPTQERLEDEAKGGVVFFGEVDYNQHGRVGNAFPAWYFSRKEEEMKEQANYIRNQIDNNMVPYSEVNIHKSRLKQIEERLGKIEASKPKLTGAQRDRIDKYRKELGEKIAESYFTYDDMHRGTADAHEEARRMMNPIIPVDPDIAKSCNLRLSKDGKVNRNDAVRAWKMMGRALGPDEPTNAEILRRAK